MVSQAGAVVNNGKWAEYGGMEGVESRTKREGEGERELLREYRGGCRGRWPLERRISANSVPGRAQKQCHSCFFSSKLGVEQVARE